MGIVLRFPSRWMGLSHQNQNDTVTLQEKAAPPKTLVEIVQDYCREHMSDPKLDIANTSHACRMHPKALSRSLSHLGTSFKAILQEQRRQFAISSIAQGELSVTDVALLTGFTQASNFSRAYKRWTGETPVEARARQQRAKVPGFPAIDPKA